MENLILLYCIVCYLIGIGIFFGLKEFYKENNQVFDSDKYVGLLLSPIIIPLLIGYYLGNKN